jgi:hypothetical protein
MEQKSNLAEPLIGSPDIELHETSFAQPLRTLILSFERANPGKLAESLKRNQSRLSDVRLKDLSKSQFMSFSTADIREVDCVVVCFDVAATKQERPLRFFHNVYDACESKGVQCVIVGVNDTMVESEKVYWEIAHRSKFAESRIEAGPAQEAALFSWLAQPSDDQMRAICTQLLTVTPKLKQSKIQGIAAASSTSAAVLGDNCGCVVAMLAVAALIAVAIYFAKGSGSDGSDQSSIVAFPCVPNSGAANHGKGDHGGAECTLNVGVLLYSLLSVPVSINGHVNMDALCAGSMWYPSC